VDRIGDTFRWKAENVSTSEVESVLREFPGITEVTVYGVSMPNTSGCAGMAHIIADQKSFDLKKFYNFVQQKLPSYAVPLFLRFGEVIEITSTFKHKKVNRRNEGFDPSIIKDPLFFCDMNQNKAYIPLTKQVFDRIMSGGSKL